jgi:aryl-alcohol dehydrogenase-like predicted oxidoreductase
MFTNSECNLWWRQAAGRSRSPLCARSLAYRALPDVCGCSGISNRESPVSPNAVGIVPRFTPEARKANQALVDLLGTVAERKKATPAQIARAWLLAQKTWIVPIPGTTKLHRMEENLGAASVELTPDDLRDIDSASSKIKVEEARYPERLEQLTGR